MFTSVLSLLSRARVSSPCGKLVRLVVVLSLTTLTATVTFAWAQEPPGIAIVSPTPDSMVIGPDITVEVVVTDFTLVPPTSTDANPGEGHIIYYLDVEPVFIPGQPAIPADPEAIFAASEQTSHTFEDVDPGPHGVFVLLVLDNHVPVFPPPAIDQVSFTVLAPAETPEPQPPLAVTETARTINIEEEAPILTPAPSLTSTPSPTPAVLAAPAQIPTAGDTPQESGSGLGLWLLIAIGVGVAAATGGVAVMVRRAGRQR